MGEQMTLRGTLQGHEGWVTQIATTPQYPDVILSASRGRYFVSRGLDYRVYCNIIKRKKSGMTFSSVLIP